MEGFVDSFVGTGTFLLLVSVVVTLGYIRKDLQEIRRSLVGIYKKLSQD